MNAEANNYCNFNFEADHSLNKSTFAQSPNCRVLIAKHIKWHFHRERPGERLIPGLKKNNNRNTVPII